MLSSLTFIMLWFILMLFLIFLFSLIFFFTELEVSLSVKFKVMNKSYLLISSNCLSQILVTESLRPKAVSKRAVEPLIPTTVINNLFLYLNTFLNVTLFENFNFFHIEVIRSNKTLLPGFGDFGLISFAGT